MNDARGSAGRGSRRQTAILVLVVAAVAAAWVWAYARATRPVARVLCVASAAPQNPRSVRGVWHWLEITPKEALLVRVAGKRTVVARAPAIVGYWPAADGLAWIARSGETSRVMLAGPDGGSPRELRASKGAIEGVWTDGTRCAWVEKRPTPKTPARFLPPLGASVEVRMSDGSSPTTVATLAEDWLNAQVIGMHEGSLIVTGMRSESIRVSVVYRLRRNAPPERIVGEVGAISTLLEGASLQWTAPSRESNYTLTGCVRTMDLGTGRVRTLADWLPAGGTLYRSRKGLVVCAGFTETAWALDARRRSAHPLIVPVEQWPIAADERGLLSVLRRKTPDRVVVSVVNRP